jgi:putative DNA primase/helicase
MPTKTSSKPNIEQDLQQADPRNRFASFQDFKDFVRSTFINGSGIAPELYAESVEFHHDLEVDDGHEANYPIHEALRWKVTRFGHQARETQYAAILKNEDGSVWQAIISEWDEEKQRAYKYLAPTANGDRVFLPPVPISIRKKISSRYGVEIPLSGSFWEWVETCNLPIINTEGGKKSLAALTQGYISLGLYGCQCGGKEKLIPDLERFHKEGRIWLFGFDRDDKQSAKRAVTMGKNRITKHLNQLNKCYIEDIFWNSEDGKGIDDLIVNKGTGAFDVAYAKAMSRLEKQFKAGTFSSSDDDKQKPPSQIMVAREIAEKYRNILAYNNEIGCWMRYAADNIGMWSRETDEYIEAVVYQIILSEGHDHFSSSFVSSVVKLLRHELIERVWNEKPPTEFLPFKNGVLEVKTGKVLEHAPGYRLTWQLPRNYVIGGNWEKINQFLEHLSAGNQAIKELLICYCNAVIKGRADLQRFLHLIGLGGTGKGSFARLIASLIGSENIHTTSLEEWCRDKFEPANAYRKRLVIFPDEDRQGGKIGKFLSLTGEDYLRAEEKHKTAFKFKYDGMVMVMSNLPIFGGEAASRVKRRVITVPCNNVVPIGQRRNLEVDFEEELPAFTNHVLSLSDDHVTAVLLGVQEIPECTLEFWENRMRVDSIAAWINQHVIYDPEASTPIGFSKHEGSNGEEIKTLFGSYSRHCLNLGNAPKSHNNFSPDLLELCKSVLNWPVEKAHSNTGKFIKGIKLRIPGVHDDVPTYDVFLSSRLSNLVTAKVTASDGSSDGYSDGLKPLPVKESDGSDGYSQNLLEISKEKKGLEIKEEISTEVVQTPQVGPADKFACPAKDDYYQDFEVKPICFSLSSAFGEISVTAEPYKRVKSTNQSKIWLVFEFADGRAAKSVTGLGDKKHLPKLAADCGAVHAWEKQQYKKWSKKVDSSDKFRVRLLNTDPSSEEDYIWMENCTLKSVPNPPSSHQFIFKSEEGKVVVAASVDDFEVMV